MRYLKRTALLIIPLLMLAGSFAFAEGGGGSGEEGTVSAVSAKTAPVEMQELADLGILGDDMEPGQYLTREEFAVLFEKVLNLSSDNPLEYLCGMGYMKTYESGDTAAGEYLTVEQAACAAVCALGYEAKAVELGGYPGGYMTMAGRLGVLDGIRIDTGNKINAETLCRALHNSLTIPMCMQTAYGAEDKYEISKDATLLSVYHNLYKGSGIVNDNGISRLYIPTSEVGRRRAEIGGMVFNAGKTNVTGLLGSRVDYYYELLRGSQEPVLRAVYASGTRNKVLRLESDTICGADYTGIEYYTANGQKRRAEIKNGAAVIYNGAAYPGYEPETDFHPADGFVELVAADGGAYSTVRIWDFESYMVEDYNIDTYELRARFGKATKIDPSDENTVLELSDADGEPCFAVDINEGTVISVAESAGGAYKKIILSRKTAEGPITSIKTMDDSTEITVNGSQFFITDEYMQSTHFDKYELSIGFNGIFFLNAFGKIVAADRKLASDMAVGYLIAAAKETGLSDRILLKLFTESGEIKEYQCVDRLQIDGSRPPDKASAMEKLAKRQLLRYTLNSEGEITRLDLAYTSQPEQEESKQSLHLDHDGSTGMFYRSSNGFAGKVFVSSGTKVFKVDPKDEPSHDEDYYRLMTGADFSDQSTYKIAAYSVNTNSFISDYIVYYSAKGGGKVANESRLMLVDEVSDFYTEKGDVVTMISGIRGGTRREYQVKDEDLLSADNRLISEVSNGDVIRVTVIDNRIEGWEMIYDFDQSQFCYSNATVGYGDAVHIAEGSVTAVRDDIMEIARNAEPADGTADRLKYKASGYKLMFYDTRGKKPAAYTGKYSEIKSYEDYDSEYSKAVIFQEWGDPRDIVVYLR